MAVLFEKKYPKPDWAQILEDDDDTKFDKKAHDYFKKLENKTVYVPIPGRKQTLKKLVQMIQDFSEKYEIDATVEQYQNGLCIWLFFDTCQFSKQVLHEFTAIADFTDYMTIDAPLEEPYEAIFFMTYHTHKGVTPKEKEQQSR